MPRVRKGSESYSNRRNRCFGRGSSAPRNARLYRRKPHFRKVRLRNLVRRGSHPPSVKPEKFYLNRLPGSTFADDAEGAVTNRSCVEDVQGRGAPSGTIRFEGDSMSYLTYWRLSRSPFSLRYPTIDYFVSGPIEDALARAEFLVQHGRRLGLLNGPHGTGKSSFFRYFLNRCSYVPKQVAGLVDLGGITPELLARRFRDLLSGDSTDGPTETSSLGRQIHEIDELLLANNALGRHPILLLDNADRASEDVVSALGILLRRPGIWTAILAVEEAGLVDVPRRILDECEMRLDLSAWDLGLTAEYMETALSKCGTRDDLFSAQGITRIHELGEGIPKRMFSLAETALAIGAAKKIEYIDADLVDQVSGEFSLGPPVHEIQEFEYVEK
jgi:type II secretory pathway predicted ATPase ExeA